MEAGEAQLATSVQAAQAAVSSQAALVSEAAAVAAAAAAMAMAIMAVELASMEQDQVVLLVLGVAAALPGVFSSAQLRMVAAEAGRQMALGQAALVLAVLFGALAACFLTQQALSAALADRGCEETTRIAAPNLYPVTIKLNFTTPYLNYASPNQPGITYFNTSRCDRHVRGRGRLRWRASGAGCKVELY